MRERHNSFPSIDNLIEAISADFEGFGFAEGSSKEREYARRQVDGTERERQRESSILTWEPRNMEAEGESEDGIVRNDKVQQQKHHVVDLSSLSMRYLNLNKDKSLPPRPLDVERRESEGREETEMESPVSLVDMETEEGGAGIGRPVNKGSSNATTATTTTAISNRSSANSDGATTTSSLTSSSSSSSSAASTANTSITTPPASASSSQPQGQTQIPPVPQQPPQPPPMTKRQHALHELLSSERAYASDLALLREVHIPLALGEFIISLLVIFSFFLSFRLFPSLFCIANVHRSSAYEQTPRMTYDYNAYTHVYVHQSIGLPLGNSELEWTSWLWT